MSGVATDREVGGPNGFDQAFERFGVVKTWVERNKVVGVGGQVLEAKRLWLNRSALPLDNPGAGVGLNRNYEDVSGFFGGAQKLDVFLVEEIKETSCQDNGLLAAELGGQLSD